MIKICNKILFAILTFISFFIIGSIYTNTVKYEKIVSSKDYYDSLEYDIEGDFNNNGRIDLQDVIVLLKCYLGIYDESNYSIEGDLNKNQKIDLQDVIILLKKYLGLYYEPEIFTVTFNSNGGSNVLGQTVIEGDIAIRPTNPTKDGFIFKEWQLNGNSYDFNAVVTDNIELMAIWMYEAIIPEDYIYSYSGNTMKYYINQNDDGLYSLAYIWLKNPYNQIKRMDPYEAINGEMYDDESKVESERLTIGEMLDGYISHNLIKTQDQVLAFNASGFYGLDEDKIPEPKSIYRNRPQTWLQIHNGEFIRNDINFTGNSKYKIIGINKDGNLKIYNQSDRNEIYNNVISDNVKFTYSFYPTLIKEGKIVANYIDVTNSARLAFCQINTNNFIMFYTKREWTGVDISETYLKNCKTLFNLDGGGSVSAFYKLAGSNTVNELTCSDTRQNICRKVSDGIYFVDDE